MKILTPLHVSGVWIPRYTSNPLETGSIGVGLNLALYSIGESRPGPCRIVFNEKSVLDKQAEIICREAGRAVETRIVSPVDLGEGFGVSANILITHTLGSYLQAGKPSLKALQLAHTLEVEYKTGLGDVIAEYTGGVAVRVEPGAPGVGRAYRLIPREYVNLLVVRTGLREDTGRMLSRMNKELLDYGVFLLNRFIETEDLRVFFESARLFTSRLFDYSLIQDVVESLKGVVDYYMKKSALIIWIEREYIDEAVSILEKRGYKPLSTTISHIGVTCVYSTKPPEKNESINT